MLIVVGLCQTVFPNKATFADPEEQESYIRDWLRHKAGMAQEADLINIHFYAGRYQPEYGSIFPAGDVTQLIPDEEADALILEEPEHLNWLDYEVKLGPSRGLGQIIPWLK